MSPKIFILSASDRYNYGDNLFPVITKKYLQLNGKTISDNIGLVHSNLSHVGALPTKSYKALYNQHNSGVLIVAGGEVLGADWPRLLSFIYPWFFFLYKNIKNKHLLKLLINTTLGYAKKNAIPYIPSDEQLLNKFMLIYHGVGGGNENVMSNPAVISTLSSAKYLSVRDSFTMSNIKTFSRLEHVTLVPDPAILASDLYSFDSSSSAQPYIVFQVGHYKNGGNLVVIDTELEKISLATGLPIYFLPIGNCPGHDDIRSLAWLKNKATYPNRLIKPDNLTSIMRTIAQSSFFIGTSLHGILTAFSFRVPFLAVNKELKKIVNYLNTWINSPYSDVSSFEDIASNTLLRLSSGVPLNDPEEQKCLVRRSFQHIAQIV